MMDDTRIPRLPKAPFIAADALLVITAIVIANSGSGPLNPALFFWVIFCVALGGVIACLPFYVEFKNHMRLAEYDKHQANLENVERLENALEGIGQISQAVHSQAERAERAATAIEGLVNRLDSRLAMLEDQANAEKEKDDPVPAMVEDLSKQINGSVASLVRELKAAQSVGQSELRELLAKSNVQLRESIDKVAAFAENQIATDIAAELSALSGRIDTLAANLSNTPAPEPGNIEIVNLSEEEATTEEAESEAEEAAALAVEEAEAAEEEAEAELEDAEYKEAVAEEFPVGEDTEEETSVTEEESEPEEPLAEEAPEPEADGEPEEEQDVIVDELEASEDASETEEAADDDDEVSFLPPEDEAELEEDNTDEEPIDEADDSVDEEDEDEDEAIDEEEDSDDEGSDDVVDETEKEAAEEEADTEEAAEEAATEEVSETEEVPKATEEAEEEEPVSDQPDLLDDIPEGSAKAKKAGRKETTLIAQVLIGIGNKPYVRGEGPGLSPDKGVPMEFLEIGKWQWVAPDASEPVTITIYKNDQMPADGEPITIEPGQKRIVSPRFG